jgi:hypothetical protein
MKRLPNHIGSLLFFGIGFLVGQYQVVERISNLPSATKDNALAKNQLTSENSFAKTAGTAHPFLLADGSNPMTNNGLVRQSFTKSALSHGMVLSAEAQGQLVAQQLEAKQTNITALDEMIRSLEESGASAKEIEDFRDIRQAIVEQPVEELQTFDTNTPEPTNNELIADLATSLEQAGIPTAEQENMLEAFAQQLESGPENSTNEPLQLPGLK